MPQQLADQKAEPFLSPEHWIDNPHSYGQGIPDMKIE